MYFCRKETDSRKISLSLQKGIAALVSLQQADGSFTLLQQARGKSWQNCHPLFSTLTVLLAASSLLPEQAVSKAVLFVNRCRRDDGTWEFDPAYGIPADSDDTACALAVLARHGNNLVSDNDVKLLRSFWRSDGGPFQTWWARDKEWSGRDRDDAVVNCNVLLALKELGSPPNMEEIDAVIRLIKKSKRGTRYYCSPTTIAYAAHRAGLSVDYLPARVINRPKSNNCVLPMAQWLSIVRKWDEDAVSYLLASQSEDGHWPIEAWFTGIANPRPFWGSSAISTALCLEALQYAVRAV